MSPSLEKPEAATPSDIGFDIVIPTSGRPELLEEALASVLAQTHKFYRVWVVNDVPQDHRDVAAMVENLGDPRVTLLSTEGTKGANFARNAGIAAGSNHLVGFLDDDDFWIPTKLEAHARAHSADPELGIVFSDYAVQLDRPFKLRFSMSGSSTETAPVAAIATSRVTARRDCLEVVGGFDEALVAYQDFDIWYRIMRRYPSRHLKESLNVIRLHAGERITQLATVKKGGEQLLEKYRDDVKIDQILHLTDERHFFLTVREARTRSMMAALKLALFRPGRTLAERAGAIVLVLTGELGYQFCRSIFRRLRST